MKNIILLLLVVSVSCTKEPVGNKFIKSGCVPQEIKHIGLEYIETSLNNEKFIFQDDKLVQLNDYVYEYDGNKLNKIFLGSDKYEEYTYDQENRVISSKQFQKENGEEEFQLILHFEYEYVEDKVTKSINKLTFQEIVFFRNMETTNIDSLIQFDSNGEVLKTEYFEYDNKPNIYSNICIPSYNFNKWITKSTRNNILKYERNNPNTENIFYTVDIIYNEFDFPITMNIVFNPGGEVVKEITYLNCE